VFRVYDIFFKGTSKFSYFQEKNHFCTKLIPKNLIFVPEKPLKSPPTPTEPRETEKDPQVGFERFQEDLRERGVT
jgi:hypothetical protein